MLRSTNERFGSDEKESSWSVPFKPELVKFNLITLPAWLQEMPNQLHGFELAFWLFEALVALFGRRVHESRSDWFSFWSLAFQLRRASASVLLSTETESAIVEKCNMDNTNRETRENTFWKLVNAMGFLKLVKRIWFNISVYQSSSFFFFKYQSSFVINGKENRDFNMNIDFGCSLVEKRVLLVLHYDRLSVTFI